MSVRRADGVIAAQVVVRSKSSIAAKVKHLLEIVCVTFVTRGRGEAFPFGAELAARGVTYVQVRARRVPQPLPCREVATDGVPVIEPTEAREVHIVESADAMVDARGALGGSDHAMSPPSPGDPVDGGSAVDGALDVALDPVREQLKVLGEFIRTQRKQSQMSLRDLASATNVSNPYLSQIERGLHEPSVRVLRSIAVALNLSVETMLVRAGVLEPDPNGDASRPADVEAAILTDPRLADDQRASLIAVYRSYTTRP